MGDIVALTKNLAKETENGLSLDDGKVTGGVTKGLIASNGMSPFYIVAVAGGSIVGFACVSPEWSDWWDCAYWWIGSLFVAERHRKKGVGRQLIDEVWRVAEVEGVMAVNLRVEKLNVNSQAFYKKVGFVADDSHIVMSRGRRPDGGVIA